MTEGEQPNRRRSASALTRAVALLARREHSALELKRKLLERGFAADEVEAALARLGEQGLQDDARFAETLARARAGSGRGPLRLKAELAQHRLSEGLAERAIEAAEGELAWADRALGLATRRLRGEDPSDPRVRRRLADFLLRRGFPQAVVWEVLGRLGERAPEAENF